MMKTISVSRRINVPAQAAWEVIRSGSAMDRWVPAITSCKLEGEGIGARRVCVIIHVSSAGPSEAEILWFVNLELDDEQAWRSVQEGIEDIYRSGIDGLESFVNAQ